MKVNWIGLGLGWILLLVSCQPAAPIDGSFFSQQVHAGDFAWEDMSPFEDALQVEFQPVLTTMHQAPYYLLDIQVDDSLEWVKGNLILRYTNASSDELTELPLQLFPVVYGGEVQLGPVSIDQQPVEPVLQEGGTIARVSFPEPLKPGESTILEMTFQASIPREMGGNYGLYGYFEDILVLDGFYPQAAVYREGDWQTQITSSNGDIKVEEMSLYQVRFQLPADLKVITTGTQISSQTNAQTQELIFSAGPVREFYLAASRDFISVERKSDGLILRSTGLKEKQAALTYALDKMEAALKSFETRYGAYPYTELDVVSTPMQALGMEYPGVSAIATGLYDLEGTIRGLPADQMLDFVIAHEIGHQWFYNLIGSDQIQEPWLDESLTQYVVKLYFSDTAGAAAASAYTQSWAQRWSRVNQAEIPIGLPTEAYDDQSYGAIIYGRGPYFFESLESSLGSAVLNQALLTYSKSNQWKIASGEDLKRALEDSCTCDLTEQFEEWVYP